MRENVLLPQVLLPLSSWHTRTHTKAILRRSRSWNECSQKHYNCEVILASQTLGWWQWIDMKWCRWNVDVSFTSAHQHKGSINQLSFKWAPKSHQSSNWPNETWSQSPILFMIYVVEKWPQKYFCRITWCHRIADLWLFEHKMLLLSNFIPWDTWNCVSYVQ